MTSHPSTTETTDSDLASNDVGSCCADLYASDAARLLLGDSFHPGGLELTRRLASLAGIDERTRVLDVATGMGSSAIELAQAHGCHVTAIDLGASRLDQARERARQAGVDSLITFIEADAAALPLTDASFDVVLCECALCTFPDKHRAASEIARVLNVGGRIALSDIVVDGDLPPELHSTLAWAACIAGACSADGYIDLLHSAGFARVVHEDCRHELDEMVRDIRGRLLALELGAKLTNQPPAGLAQLDLPGAARIGNLAAQNINEGVLTYALFVGELERSDSQP